MIYKEVYMRDLYIDCDGVIFNTIKPAFKEMKSLGVDLDNQDAITDYFRKCDWNKLIELGGPINNSIEKIKILYESNEFERVNVATHRCSYLEGVIKRNKFNNLIPHINIFTIPKDIPKQFALKAPGNILIDDAKRKIEEWVNDGGIGILFKQDVNGLIYPGELDNPNYFITNDLLDSLVVNNLYKEKTYRKTL